MLEIIIETITKQYNEGLIALCNICEQLTYNTTAFVCTNCKEENENGLQ